MHAAVSNLYLQTPHWVKRGPAQAEPSFMQLGQAGRDRILLSRAVFYSAVNLQFHRSPLDIHLSINSFDGAYGIHIIK